MTGIELAVAGWIASPAIRMVVDKAKSYLGSNFDEHKKTREMLDNLETTLPRIQLVVKMAEQRPSQGEAMGKWLRDLKLAVSNAEDVLDDFEADSIRENLKGKGKVSEFALSSVKTLKNMVFLDDKLRKLKKAVSRIQLVCSGVGDLLKILELNDKATIEGSTSTNTKETSSVLPKIFGRDKEIESILKMIEDFDPFYAGKSDDKPKPENKEGETSSTFPGDPDIILRFGGTVVSSSTIPYLPVRFSESGSSQGKKEIQNIQSNKPNVLTNVSRTRVQKIEVNNWTLGVLPLVGINGVGKTTLAKVIYNSELVEKRFEKLKSWVYISDSFNPKKLLIDIIFSFGGSVDHDRSLDFVMQTLVGIIKEKQFFLVLDDVWESFLEAWSDTLLCALKKGSPGSVVIVTTQSQDVAEWMRTWQPIKLDALPFECFLALFKYHAFGHPNKMSNLIDDDINKLESIGESIAKKLNCIPLEAEIIGYILREKLNVKHWTEISDSGWWKAESAAKYILPALGVGYQNLKPELKQSFLYSLIFPKSYVFEKHRLVQMWISHGFVQPSELEQSQIERGEKRLEDIGNQRFEMLVDRFFFQPTVSENKFLMHDLVRELGIAISSNEFYIINNDSEIIPPFSCHLTLNNNSLPINLGDSYYKILRTLIFSGSFKEPMSPALLTILNKSCSLRLLNLSHKSIEINKFSKVFKHLLHLRFLDLSYIGIDSLPDTISLLCHLQVLDLRGCNFQKLPKEIKNLINLRHLYASAETISLISSIGNLINLQELEQFMVKIKEGHKISELRDLNEIRGTLRILNLNNVRTEKEATDSNLSAKRHLDCLMLEWEQNSSNSLQEVAERLKPPSNLGELKITNLPLTHFPNWIKNENLYEKLKRLELCGGPLKDLPPLGQLPLLEVLKLKRLYYVEKINSEFYGSCEIVFPSLKELILIEVNGLKEWSDIEGGKTFPLLRKLHLESCWELEVVPIHSFSKSVTELYNSSIPDSAQISIFRQLTALTRLTIRTKRMETALCCDENWKSVAVLLLEGVEIDGEIRNLLKVQELHLYDVHFSSSLTEQPQQEPGLQLLTSLEFTFMPTDQFHFLGTLPRLRTLSIRESFTNFVEMPMEQEIWFKQLTSLEEIEFEYCYYLTVIPIFILTITSLKKLTIKNCSSFRAIANRLPESLRELRITKCSEELVQRCSPEGGEDWPNISHVPYIRIEPRRFSRY